MTRRELHRLLAQSGFLPEPERVDPEHLLAFIESAIWWYTTADEPVQLTPEIADAGDARELGSALQLLPPRCATRTCVPSTCSAGAWSCSRSRSSSQLRARANWHRIAREWMYGEEPLTELGQEEAEFYAPLVGLTADWAGVLAISTAGSARTPGRAGGRGLAC